MILSTAYFLARNGKRLAGLRGQVEVIRQGRGTAEEFSLLGKAMERYRDFLRDNLAPLSLGERKAVESRLFPAISPLVEEAQVLVDAAWKSGRIPECILCDLGMLGSSLLFVAAFESFMVEAREPGGKKPLPLRKGWSR